MNQSNQYSEPLADWEKELLGITTSPQTGSKPLPSRLKRSAPKSGRCASKSLTVSGRHQSWGRFDFAVVHPRTQEAIPVKHWKDLARIRKALKEEGFNFDGQVASAPKGQLKKALGEGTAAFEYMDESTAKGGYPVDTPDHIKASVGEILNDLRATPTVPTSDSEIRDFRATVAMLLREQGYPKLSKEEILELSASVFPVLSDAKVVNGKIRLSTPQNRVTGALALRRALPSDFEAIYAQDTTGYLASLGKESFKRDFDVFPTFVAWDPRGEVKGFVTYHPDSNDGFFAAYNSYNSYFYNVSTMRATQDYMQEWLSNREATVKNLCHCCYADPCSCSSSPESYLKRIRSIVNDATRAPDDEHRWGKECAVRPTLDTHLQAVGKLKEVNEIIDRVFPGGLTEAKVKYGSNVAYNLSFFLEQAKQEPAFLEVAHKELFKELEATRARFTASHRVYAKTMYEEFESSNSDARERVAEVHLGRDGIYAYSARQAQLRTMRLALSPAERKARRAKENALKYIIVSRNAQWHPEEHDSLIGDLRPVFIDTGFAGSIPERILYQRSANLDSPVPASVRERSIRLFSSRIPEYGFKTQINKEQAYIIEHDAKPTRSTSHVNGGRPTSALEQLVFRQLRDFIREDSAAQTQALLNSSASGSAAASKPVSELGPDPALQALKAKLKAPAPAPESKPVPSLAPDPALQALKAKLKAAHTPEESVDEGLKSWFDQLSQNPEAVKQLQDLMKTKDLVD